MPFKLNQAGYEHATKLIRARRVVRDQAEQWNDHRPSIEQRKEFIKEHDLAVYGDWHLGIDADRKEDEVRRYALPFGDFESLHRCGLLAAEAGANRYGYKDIEDAALRLRLMVDETT